MCLICNMIHCDPVPGGKKHLGGIAERRDRLWNPRWSVSERENRVIYVCNTTARVRDPEHVGVRIDAVNAVRYSMQRHHATRGVNPLGHARFGVRPEP